MYCVVFQRVWKMQVCESVSAGYTFMPVGSIMRKYSLEALKATIKALIAFERAKIILYLYLFRDHLL